MAKHTDATLLTDGAGQIISQYFDTADTTGSPNGTFKPVTLETLRQILVQNFPESQNVVDMTAVAKLNEVESLIQQLNDKLAGTLVTKVTGNAMEYFGKSTDVKPVNANVPVGATYFEIDTAIAYMNDGATWVVI